MRSPGRQLPHNLEAERGFLGCLLHGKPVLDGLHVDDFVAAEHRVIIEAAREIADAGGQPDLPTVWQRLQGSIALDDVGGLEYLRGLVEDLISPANGPGYAGLIKESAHRRREIELGDELADRAYRGEDTSDLYEALARHGRDGSTPNGEVVDFAAWQGRPIPDREWLVRDWLPAGCVSALYGDGGVGKSLVAQQLMTCTAIRRAWFGIVTEPVRSLGLFCEDSKEELWIRQAAINEHYGCGFEDLGACFWLARLGHDNSLVTFNRGGAMELTPLYFDLLGLAKRRKAQLLVLDTAADVFDGEENIRRQVRRFLQAALGRMAREIDGAVLLCAHPSRSGLSTGEGDGASTAWSNTVRSRLFLSRCDDSEHGEGARILARRKANYAAANEQIRLHYRDGVFVPDEVPTGIIASIEKRNAETAFLEALDQATAAGRKLSDAKSSGNYAPRTLLQVPITTGLKLRDLERAMARLFAAGAIRMVPYGPPSRGFARMERVT